MVIGHRRHRQKGRIHPIAKAQCENIRTALCYQDNCGSVAPLLSYF